MNGWILKYIIYLDDPEKDEKVQGNPFNTLFIGRLSYDLQEDDLMREFEQYGPVKHVCTLRRKETRRERLTIDHLL